MVMEFMFLGINMFWALLRAHFFSLGGSGKVSLSQVNKHI